MPALDQVGAVALGAGHVVAQRRRRVAVHQHLAGDEPHAACAGRSKQRVHAHLVDGGKNHRAGGAALEQRVQKARRTGLGHRRVGKAQLGWKGVGAQPVEQLGAVAGNHVDLRAVDMRVDKARQQQLAPVVAAHPAVARRLVARLHAGDAAVLHQQPVVRPKAHGGRIDHRPGGGAGEVEQVAAQGHAGGVGGLVRHGSPALKNKESGQRPSCALNGVHIQVLCHIP